MARLVTDTETGPVAMPRGLSGGRGNTHMSGSKSDRRAWLILLGAIALAFVAANVYHMIWGSSR